MSLPLAPPSLSQPLYGATFLQALRRFFLKYARFKGFASLSEYWWVQLGLLGISFVVLLLSGLIGGDFGGSLFLLYMAAVLVPTLSLSWRRLHDAGFAGPWFFVSFIPLVGGLIFLILTLQPTNQYKHRPEWHDLERR